MKQNHKTRRLTALLLALVMLFSLAPTALAAEFPYFSPGNIEFTTVQEGYTVGEGDGYDVAPFPTNIYADPAGTPEALTLTLEGTNADAFSVSPERIPADEFGGSVFTVAVTPNTGLTAGPYTATLRAKGNTVDITAPVTFTVTAAPAHIPVTGITGVPTSTTAGTSLTLTGTVEPEGATHKDIVWSLVSEGTTAAGAAVNNGVLTATGPGAAKVKAAIENGTAVETPYEETFTVTVEAAPPQFVAVTNIGGITTDMRAQVMHLLEGVVEPSDATNKNIVWSVVDPGNTGARLLRGIVLFADREGTATVRATIAGGTAEGDYTQDFTFTVNPRNHIAAPVTNISGVPTRMEMVGLPGGDHIVRPWPLELTGTVEPYDATHKEIVWSVANDGGTGAIISGNTLRATRPGTIEVTATIVNGKAWGEDYVQHFSITTNAEPTVYMVKAETGEDYQIRVHTPANGGEKYLEILGILPKNGQSQLSVPEQIDLGGRHGSLKVRQIDKGVINSSKTEFWNTVTGITLPDTVTVIGENNFVGLAALRSLSLSASLRDVKHGCFRGLPELPELTFPASLAEVNFDTLTDNPSLRKVVYLGSPSMADIATGPDGLRQRPFTNCSPDLIVYGPAGSRVQSVIARWDIPYVVPAALWEYFTFANSFEDFFHAGEPRRYNLTAEDWNTLKRNLGADRKGAAQLNALKYYADTTDWGGSCYGIAAAEGLLNYGYLDSSAVPGGKPGAAAKPRDDARVESLINYHFLLQLLPDFAGGIKWGCREENTPEGTFYHLFDRVDYTDTLRDLVETVEKQPIILSYWFPQRVGYQWQLPGHAILVHTAEKVSDTRYNLLAEDNRFPGEQTPITVDLSGTGSMELHYPDGYGGYTEDMLGLRYSGDFKEYKDKMPYNQLQGGITSREEFFQLFGRPGGGAQWDVEVDENGVIHLQPAAAARAEDDAVLHIPTTSDGKVSLRGLVVSSTADGAPADSRFLYNAPGASGIVLESAPGEPVSLAFAGSGGFSGVTAGGAAKVSLGNDGAVDAQDLSGSVSIASTAGDGTLVTVRGAASGAETDDFKVTPGQDKATITAPAGQFQVDMSAQDGRETSTTIVSDGTKPVDVQTPPPPPSGGGGGGGSSGNDRSPTEEAVQEIGKAKDGDTVEVKLPANGKLPGKVLEAAAGKDVTLEVGAGNGLTWIIKGTDIPKGKLSDLNLKVDAKANTIPVSVINAVTGKQKVMQLNLSHSGPFGFALTLRLDTGKENAGLFANLYYYNETAEALEYQSAAKIGADGNADLPFAHASSYAVVIDKTSHAPVTWENPFTDVSESDWFYSGVEYVNGAGLMNGTSATTFGPHGPMTRGMFVTTLYRLAGNPPDAGEGGAFTDVPDGAYYADAVRWASAKGIVKGTSATTFDPDRPVTRQEMAVIMHGYATAMGHELPADREAVTFTDANAIGSWAADAVSAMQRAGILNGKDGGRFDPTGTATRAEVAAVLRRFLEAIGQAD